MNTRRLPGGSVHDRHGVYVFLHAPLLGARGVLVQRQSKFGVEWKGFTLQWYQRLLERHDILDGLVTRA
jgi:ABC-type spermidine/putrescine transport system permease subunit II